MRPRRGLLDCRLSLALRGRRGYPLLSRSVRAALTLAAGVEAALQSVGQLVAEFSGALIPCCGLERQRFQEDLLGRVGQGGSEVLRVYAQPVAMHPIKLNYRIGIVGSSAGDHLIRNDSESINVARYVQRLGS